MGRWKARRRRCRIAPGHGYSPVFICIFRKRNKHGKTKYLAQHQNVACLAEQGACLLRRRSRGSFPAWESTNWGLSVIRHHLGADLHVVLRWPEAPTCGQCQDLRMQCCLDPAVLGNTQLSQQCLGDSRVVPCDAWGIRNQTGLTAYKTLALH